MFLLSKQSGRSGVLYNPSAVFSAKTYTGTGATATIVNNVDITSGGMVLIKNKGIVSDFFVFDTGRGVNNGLSLNTAIQSSLATSLSGFGSTGFTIGANGNINTTSGSYISCAFKKAAKFFDIISYSTSTPTHSLAVVPELILTKNYTHPDDWVVYHKSLTTGNVLALNSSSAAYSKTFYSNITASSLGCAITSYSSVASITVSAGGSYTSTPSVSFSGGGGSGATATANLSGVAIGGGAITAVPLPTSNSFTSTPSVSFIGGGGSGATATANLSGVAIGGGAITAVPLPTSNSFTSTPSVSFSGGGGSGATATANLSVLSATENGRVNSVSVSGGSYSSTGTQLSISQGAGTATITISALNTSSPINTLSGGGAITAVPSPTSNSFTSTPSISFSGGGGSGAAATAIMTGGAISSLGFNPINISSQTPSLAASGGSGTGATFSPVVSMGLTGITPGRSVYYTVSGTTAAYDIVDDYYPGWGGGTVKAVINNTPYYLLSGTIPIASEVTYFDTATPSLHIPSLVNNIEYGNNTTIIANVATGVSIGGKTLYKLLSLTIFNLITSTPITTANSQVYSNSAIYNSGGAAISRMVSGGVPSSIYTVYKLNNFIINSNGSWGSTARVNSLPDDIIKIVYGTSSTFTYTTGWFLTRAMVTNGGSLYDSNVVFKVDNNPASLTSLYVSPWTVSSVSITNGGSLYSSGTTVTYTGQSPQTVTSISPLTYTTTYPASAATFTNGNYGFTSDMSLTFSGGATGTAYMTYDSTYYVNSVSITNGGSLYSSGTTVTYTGQAAQAVTSISPLTYNVSSITVNSGGSNYTSAPTVSISGGGGSGATATASVSAATPGSYVSYMFATSPGLSKVGTYTGNGTSLNIDCSFGGGSRFILIKRSDGVGNWYCWDNARGITSSTEPYLTLDTTAAEVTTSDSITPYTAGFTAVQNATTNINVTNANYIYLAVA